MNEIERREIREAIDAADDALMHLNSAKRYLGSAGNWGLVDLFSGGMISGLLKHSKMSKAEREVQAAKSLAICIAMLMMTACGSSESAGASVADMVKEEQQNEQKEAVDAENVEQPQEEEDIKMQELEFTRDGLRIYGRLYLPDGEGRFPTVIMGHGFGANLSMMEGYARAFAEDGIAAYAFDFIGGGYGIKSDGTMTDMSVLTEAADMSAVLDGIREMDFCDNDNVFVMGGSQGGFVATYIAGTRPGDVKGLIAFYPAYVLQDDSKERTNNGANITDTSSVMGMTIGRIYDEDAQSFDIYEVMKNFNKNALLIHGTADSIVPYSYSERAVETLPSAELIKIEGAGHGFYGNDEAYATERAIEFVKNNLGDSAMSDGMKLVIGNETVPIIWENNASVEELRAITPLTIDLSMYGGFEQVGSIGRSITRNDKQTTTSPGDVVLYSGNQIVIFYGSNSWAYTKLGHIDMSEDELAKMLDNGDVQIKIGAE